MSKKEIKIVPFRDYEELHSINWIATKDETIEACITGLKHYNADSLEINELKTLSLKELTEIKNQHGNITIEKFMNLKFCLDCENWKDYENFYERKKVRKGIVKIGYYTYCSTCYYKRNKRTHKKWYGKHKNKEKKSIYGKRKREREKYGDN